MPLFQRVDDGHDAALSRSGFVAGLEAIQHEERCIAGKVGLQAHGFDELGDEEVTAALGIKRGGDPVCAKPIGIRLDDGGSLARRDLGRKPPVVARKSRQVDRQVTRRVAVIVFRAVHVRLPRLRETSETIAKLPTKQCLIVAPVRDC